jgi:hypothetical protein
MEFAALADYFWGETAGAIIAYIYDAAFFGELDPCRVSVI